MTIPWKPGARPRRSTAEKLEAAVDRVEQKERIVSSSRFAALTGFDRGTLKAWIDKGCPTEGRGPKGEVLVDVKAVWRWREDQIRTETLKEVRADELRLGGEKLTPGDIYKIEQTRLTRLKIAREAEILLPREFVEYALERMFGVVRQAVMGVPERLFRKMSGFDPKVKSTFYREAQKQCRAALAGGSQAIVVVLPDMEARLAAALPALADLPTIQDVGDA